MLTRRHVISAAGAVLATPAIAHGPSQRAAVLAKRPATPAIVIPFAYDANTFWWDFTASDNAQDANGTTTLSSAKERIRSKYPLLQPNKSEQPLVAASGINFNQATLRNLVMDPLPHVTSGKNGYYIAFCFTPHTGNGFILSIGRNASTAASRCSLYLSSSRNIILKANTTDNTTVNAVFTSAALALDVKYVVEVLWDLDADAYTLLINGVVQSLTAGAEVGPWNNFPATDPSSVVVGNGTNGAITSLDGTLREMIFQDGVPASGIVTSARSYLIGRA